MKRNQLLSALFIAGMSLLISTASFGQTKKDAVDAYNAGATTYKQDPKAALDNLLKSIEISQQLGEEGEETLLSAQSLIPRVYLEIAMSEYKQKNLQGTLDNLEKAEETATKYNDETTKSRVEKTMPKLYNVMGNNKFKENKFDEAIANYTKALNFNPDYVDPLLGLALSYENKGDEAKMIEYLDKTIEVAKKNNDLKTADETSLKVKNFYLKKGDDAQKDKNYSEAIDYLNKTMKYDSTDASVYQVLAVNYNRVEKWNDAVEAANKAIELSKGAAEDKAPIYWELANAYQKLNNTSKACDAFKNASYGTIKPAADYQIQQMKCQ